MAQLNIHPAPNRLGQMTPGFLVVPYNPVGGASRVDYKPHIGEFMAGALVTPYNPLLNRMASGNILYPVAATGSKNINTGANGTSELSGMSGGCGCASCSDGLGNMDLGQLMQTINPGYIAAGIIALFLVMRLKK